MSTPKIHPGFRDFGLAVLAILILRIIIERSSIPFAYLGAVSLLVSALFIALPVAALFRGSSFPWKWSTAAGFIALGAFLQFGLVLLVPKSTDLTIMRAVFAIAQSGLIIWCLGLGAALSLALKDKNLIVPISIFLALFDIWLVFVPEGPVGQVARGNQTALTQMAFTVPKPVEAPTGAAPMPLAYIGPADFLFMAMFFCVIYRFKLRAKETAIAMAPVLAIYLAIALFTPNVSIGPIRLGALPALVPIAAVVMAVNWREFKFTKDEKQTTIVLTIICLALLIWRFMVAEPPSPPKGAPSEPSPSVRALESPKPGERPEPRPMGQSQ